MGKHLEREHFHKDDFTRFNEKIQQQLASLKSLLDDEQFSRGDTSLGAELEMYLADAETLRPTPRNLELIDLLDDKQVQPELNRYNLEFNLAPVAAAGEPFSQMISEADSFLTRAQGIAESRGVQIVPIGILPTLRQDDLQQQQMTDIPRYRALQRGLYNLRGQDFEVNINGNPPLMARCDSVTMEGANTSFQVHLKVPASRFARHFNAAQLTTPLVLALAGNSPLLFGHELWAETRIALFKQAIDSREPSSLEWRPPARVSFGQGWLREGAYELFAETVSLYPPIMPIIDEESDKRFALPELCLHHGTVWPWNRAVYSGGNDRHLRIEFRALPSGPTLIDMMANAALAIGWTIGLEEDIDELLVRLPFKYAEYNFYRAAQSGLNAKILWPSPKQRLLAEADIREVIEMMLPYARHGLRQIGVDDGEIDRLLKVIEQRISTEQTGASWQLAQLKEYEKHCQRKEALFRMLKDYVAHQQNGDPVATWTIS